jgi:hypothetical protein
MHHHCLSECRCLPYFSTECVTLHCTHAKVLATAASEWMRCIHLNYRWSFENPNDGCLCFAFATFIFLSSAKATRKVNSLSCAFVDSRHRCKPFIRTSALSLNFRWINAHLFHAFALQSGTAQRLQVALSALRNYLNF